MSKSLAGFKKFFEEMDPSPEKSMSSGGDKKQDYWDSLEDEGGLSLPDIKTALTSEPWVSSHFPLGKKGKEIQYKLQPWKIVKGSMSPSGADIKLVHNDHERSYLKDIKEKNSASISISKSIKTKNTRIKAFIDYVNKTLEKENNFINKTYLI